MEQHAQRGKSRVATARSHIQLAAVDLQERLYLASLSPEIRSELKLVCTFCGTVSWRSSSVFCAQNIRRDTRVLQHKVGQTSENHHHHLRQRRSAHADAIMTAASLRRAEADILSAAQPDCSNVY